MRQMDLFDQTAAKGSDPPWGKAPDRRGRRYRLIAAEFLRRFPLHTRLAVPRFDEWAAGQEPPLYCLAPPGAGRDSDEWVAMVARRNFWKKKINRAAEHPSMIKLCGAFTVAVIVPGVCWEVRPPEEQALQADVAGSTIQKLCTNMAALRRMMQAIDFGKLSEAEQSDLEMLFEEHIGFERLLDVQCDTLRRKVERFARRSELRGRAAGPPPALPPGGEA